MKKFINTIKNKINSIAISAKTVLESKKGEGYIDTGVKIIIGVVVGGVLLAGLYALFNTTIIPTLTTKITQMFSYSGTPNWDSLRQVLQSIDTTTEIVP